MKRIFDLHIHTVCSRSPLFPTLQEGFCTFDRIVEEAKRKKLHGVAITDHNTLIGALKFADYVESNGEKLEVVIGEEIRTKAGDVIALGIKEKIPPRLCVEETLDLIKRQDGLSVAPHPCSRYFGGVGEDVVRRYPFDAIETLNYNSSPYSNRKAGRLAKMRGLPEVAGSDAHIPNAIGKMFTEVECGSDIFDAIKAGKTKVYGLERRYPIDFGKAGMFIKYLLGVDN